MLRQLLHASPDKEVGQTGEYIGLMGSNKNNRGLGVGEVIRIKTTLGLPPDGVYRVERVSQGSVLLSAGEVQCVTSVKELQILERGIVGPVDWLGAEIAILEGMLKMCDCEECRRKLESKRALRS